MCSKWREICRRLASDFLCHLQEPAWTNSLNKVTSHKWIRTCKPARQWNYVVLILILGMSHNYPRSSPIRFASEKFRCSKSPWFSISCILVAHPSEALPHHRREFSYCCVLLYLDWYRQSQICVYLQLQFCSLAPIPIWTSTFCRWTTFSLFR